MILLLVVALVLAWPTYGISLLLWIVLSSVKAAARRAAIERRQEVRAELEPLFRGRFDEFYLGLEVPTRRDEEPTEQEAAQCGRHILGYLAHNPSEAETFMKGLAKQSRRFGGSAPNPAAAARNETFNDAKGEIHLASWRAIEAVATQNPGLPCFRAVHIDVLKSRITRLESLLKSRETDLDWVHAMRDWLAHETEAGFPKDGTASTMQAIRQLSWVRHRATVCFPDEIVNLANLEEITAVGQVIRTLPAVLSRLPKLRVLEVYACELERIAPEIGNLQGLRSLSLADNPIASLPETITKLRGLVQLDLSYTPNLRLTDAQHRWLEHLVEHGCEVKRADRVATGSADAQTTVKPTRDAQAYASDLPF